MTIVDFAASVAIIENKKILLTRRLGVEAWCLPGGRVEAGESVAQAAIREAHEETGLEIQLTRLVGIYYVPHWKYGDNHEVLFAATPTGGTLLPQPSEVSEEGFFDPMHLPEPLLWWHRQRIMDAINGVGGSVVWMQDVRWPFPGEDVEDKSHSTGKSKPELFLEHFSKPDPPPADIEILLVGEKHDDKM